MEDTQSRAHTQAKVEAEELFQKQRQVKTKREEEEKTYLLKSELYTIM